MATPSQRYDARSWSSGRYNALSLTHENYSKWASKRALVDALSSEATRLSGLVSLTLPYNIDLTATNIEAILSNNPDLQIIRYENFVFCDDVFASILGTNGRRITSVQLQGMITDKGFTALISGNIERLKRLSITGTITESSVAALTRSHHAHTLQSLSIISAAKINKLLTLLAANAAMRSTLVDLEVSFNALPTFDVEALKLLSIHATAASKQVRLPRGVAHAAQSD